MAQTAFTGNLAIVGDTWVKISEIDCTFLALDDQVEFRAGDGTETASDTGIPYDARTGEVVDNTFLSWFPGVAAADGIYALCRGKSTEIFVSRAATA